jgi:alginate O-acetyltransferase complex protein AlgI
MVFNSYNFIIFLVTVVCLYIILGKQWQNRMLLAASYIFYAFWDVRFLALLLLCTIIAYTCALKINGSTSDAGRKRYLACGVIGNLLLLAVFKYFNFFVDSLSVLSHSIGLSLESNASLLLPIGISAYTFRAIAYTVDVYNNRLQPERKFLPFSLFISYFPQLISGPIERAENLLPQINLPRKITSDRFALGCYLIFWGLFEKAVIADNLALIIKDIYSVVPYNGMNMLLAIYLFVFQLYCDFDGYSNVALGIGEIMGFKTMLNFNIPLFALNIQDFWKRWHIGLSSWTHDYIYTPVFLRLNRFSPTLRLYITLLITMLLLGLWHGATWNFLIYGIYHGCLLIIFHMTGPAINKAIQPKSIFAKKIWTAIRIFFLFHVIATGFLLFKVQSLNQLGDIFHALICNFVVTPSLSQFFFKAIPFVFIAILYQLFQYGRNDLVFVLKQSWLVQIIILCFFCFLFLTCGVTDAGNYIYFRF